MVNNMLVKAGLLTTVLTDVLSAIEKEYEKKIFLIYAQREFSKESPKSGKLLPYLTYREYMKQKIELNKESESSVPLNEWKKIIGEIRSRGFVDLTITQLGFILENTSLKETIEKSLSKKIAPTKFVILFRNNKNASKEAYISRDIMAIMKEYVNKLNFQYSSLELVGIYTLQDWRSKRKYNFLTTEKINIEKDVLRDIICSLFKHKIKISGNEMEIRFIKWYEQERGNVLKLVGYEKV